MTLHMAIKAVADGNETCTAGRLDDRAFVGASAVEFGCMFVEGGTVRRRCAFLGGVFVVHLVDRDRKFITTLTLTVKTLENAHALE